MVLIHQHSPLPLNPLGVKGVGEGGAVAPPAAIANALSPFGAEFNATPIKFEQIVQAVRSAPPA
jgi:carbon-monoxide dehydrogenase large subunit